MKLNRPLTLSEKIQACRAQNEILPLKGHIKLVLEDVRDGTQIIEEKDNLITNAVSDLLSRNFNGDARFDMLMPMYDSLYGGIFAFENTQTENVNNWSLESDEVNKLVAHAGDVANTGGSKLRGSPVSNETIITDTSISRTWIWDNTQGVGHIESCSLVPALLGNMGTKPYDTDYNPLKEFGNDGASGSTGSWTEAKSYRYPFSIDPDGKTSRHIWADEYSFKETQVRHDYFAFGIMRSINDFQVVNSRTASIREFINNKSFVFDDDDYYYICKATDSTHLQVDKVSKSTFEVTQADCEFSGVSLWTGTIQTYLHGDLKVFAYDGTYLYYPNNLGTGFYKLNLADNSDKLALDGTITINKGELSSSASGGEQFASPIVLNEGLILGDNYIINGSKAYQIAQTKRIGTANTYLATKSHLWLCKVGTSVYGNARQYYDSSRSAQSNVLCQMFKSSVVNLDSPKDKGTSQTMRITYSLSEITS